jgi:hypothetical protein
MALCAGPGIAAIRKQQATIGISFCMNGARGQVTVDHTNA